MSIPPSYPWYPGDRLPAQQLDEAIAAAQNAAADAKQVAVTAMGTANGAVTIVNGFIQKLVPVSITIPFPPGFVVSSGAYVMSEYVPYDFLATGVAATVGTAGGSFDLAFTHDGISMGNLGAITVNQGPRVLFAASGSNLAVPTGAVLTMNVSNVTGNPVGAAVSLIGYRTP